MPRLENWAIIATGSPYTAPEAMTAHLTGYIYEDRRFGDGTFVRTSRLASLVLDDGKEKSATTASGTVYTLGAPHGDFVRFMESNGYSLDDYAKRL